MNKTTNMLTGFEELEDRILLSGNVVVSLVDGDLRIAGDTQSNDIRILNNASGGMRVFGANGTTINGSTQFTTQSKGVRDVIVNMRAGSDKVLYQSNVARRFVTINTHSGMDKVKVRNATISKIMKVNTGGAGDCLRVTNSSIDKLEATTLAGNDRIIFEAGTSIQRGASVKTGGNNDLVRVENSTVNGSVLADLGAGDDRLGTFNSVFTGNVRVLGQTGSDIVVVDGSDLLGNVTVLGGDGNDKVGMLNNSQVGDSAANNLTISLGRGIDFLGASDSTLKSTAVLNGSVGVHDNIAFENLIFNQDNVTESNFEGSDPIANIDTLVSSLKNFQC